MHKINQSCAAVRTWKFVHVFDALECLLSGIQLVKSLGTVFLSLYSCKGSSSHVVDPFLTFKQKVKHVHTKICLFKPHTSYLQYLDKMSVPKSKVK